MHDELPSNYQIKCVYKEAGQIYVNTKLEVFPCCYISDEKERGRLNRNVSQVHMPISELNLKNKTWTEIFDHPFYKQKIVESFGSSDRLDRCVFTCGVVEREKNQNQIVEF
jgi:hypothetical protein